MPRIRRRYGSTHFLEHLLFKGTTSRTALDIAISFDAVGGEHNALTAKEYTCYYAKVQDRDLPMAVEVLADMFTSSLLDPVEFDNERGVILEELSMAGDDPADVANERFFEAVLGEHPLGRPDRRQPRDHPRRDPRGRAGALPRELPPAGPRRHRRRRRRPRPARRRARAARSTAARLGPLGRGRPRSSGATPRPHASPRGRRSPSSRARPSRSTCCSACRASSPPTNAARR